MKTRALMIPIPDRVWSDIMQLRPLPILLALSSLRNILVHSDMESTKGLRDLKL
jgi:hypothetical protein